MGTRAASCTAPLQLPSAARTCARPASAAFFHAVAFCAVAMRSASVKYCSALRKCSAFSCAGPPSITALQAFSPRMRFAYPACRYARG